MAASESHSGKKRGARQGGLPDRQPGTGSQTNPEPAESFYTPQLEEEEIQDLKARLARGLEDEIALLRIYTRRVLDLASGSESLKESVQALGALGLASTRLANLLKVQQELLGDNNSARQAISQALSEVLDDLGLS
jgi:hypothetical protein